MEVPRHWRLRKQRYGLVGEVCPHCDAKIFPPRDVCPECGGEAKNLFNFSGRGEVYSYTTIYEPPQGYEDQAPYTVALVKLEEGPFISGQILGADAAHPETIQIGAPVSAVCIEENNNEHKKVHLGFQI